jgi:hypothetical protein
MHTHFAGEAFKGFIRIFVFILDVGKLNLKRKINCNLFRILAF